MSDADAPYIPPEVEREWYDKAVENVVEWGLQSEETLLLAMMEEMGELTQAFLEAEHEGGDQERVEEELDDLGALLFQFYMARKDGESSE